MNGRLARLIDAGRRLLPFGGVALVVWSIQLTGLNEFFDLLVYDLVIASRPARSGDSDPITIIEITEEDIKKLGWPIDDRHLCSVIEIVSSKGATAIGLDLFRDQGVGTQQECLKRLAQENDRLVSIFNLAEDIRPIRETPASRQAYNDLIIDPDNVIRRSLVHVGEQDEATVSLPLRLVEVSTESKRLRQSIETDPTSHSWLERGSGGYVKNDAAGFQEMLAFRRPGSFRTWDLQTAIEPNGIPLADIQNRIILIGSSAPSLKDSFAVPHTRFIAGTSQYLMPGVEIHAQRVASLLDRDTGNLSALIQPTSDKTNTIILVLLSLAGIGLGTAINRVGQSVATTAGLAVLYISLSVGLLLNNIWIGFSLPLLSMLLMAAVGWMERALLTQHHRIQMERLLGKISSPDVAKRLWEHREDLLKNGRFQGLEIEATILFSDTANFTTVSEGFSPSELLDWLNRGMCYCIPAITSRGGMINKFTGDGFLAAFGVPISRGDKTDAAAAIEAALEIQQKLSELNDILTTEQTPNMRLRIGIHSGPVLAGSMGTEERLEYCVLGDAVNCASRLESIDKERHDNICRVLVSDATRSLLGHDETLLWVDWGELQVKGRSEPIKIWELRGRATSNEPEKTLADSVPTPQ